MVINIGTERWLSGLKHFSAKEEYGYCTRVPPSLIQMKNINIVYLHNGSQFEDEVIRKHNEIGWLGREPHL